MRHELPRRARHRLHRELQDWSGLLRANNRQQATENSFERFASTSALVKSSRNVPSSYWRQVVCKRVQLMATKSARQNVVVILGAVMIVCLALTIVTFPIALIWFGQPLGNAGLVAADAFASVFSVAFFAAFALAMAEQRSRSPTDLSTVLLGTPVPHDQNDQ
jgi:hypothetical protein